MSAPVQKSASMSNKDQKPLHKRIDREEYMKDVNRFYGAGPENDSRLPSGPAGEAVTGPEPSKISKIMESIEVGRFLIPRTRRRS